MYATSYVTQGMAIAAGLQEEFDWKAMRDMGTSGAVAGIASFAGAWISAANMSAGYEALARGGVAVASQVARDGEVTSVSGVLMAMVPAGERLKNVKNAWWQETLSDINDHRNTVSAGLAVLEASIRGDAQAMSWANLATAAVGDRMDATRGSGYFDSRGINWNRIAGETVLNMGLAAVVNQEFGEDAALNFFGTGLGNSITATLSGRAAWQGQFASLKNAGMTEADARYYADNPAALKQFMEEAQFRTPVFAGSATQVAMNDGMMSDAGGGILAGDDSDRKRVIGKGDTLWSIAKDELAKAGGDTSDAAVRQKTLELIAANPGLDPRKIRVDKAINLTGGVVNDDVVTAYNTSDAELRRDLAAFGAANQAGADYASYDLNGIPTLSRARAEGLIPVADHTRSNYGGQVGEMRAPPGPEIWYDMLETPGLGRTMRAGIAFADSVISGFKEGGNLVGDAWNYMWGENRSAVTGEFFPESQLGASVQTRGLGQTGLDMISGLAHAPVEVFAGDPERIGAGLAFWAPAVGITRLARGGIPGSVPDSTVASTRQSGFVFRGDGRSPDVIFEQGFQPRGTNQDLLKYAQQNVESVFVPTSKSPNVAREYADMQGDGFVYTIRGQAEGVDVNAVLGAKSPFPGDLEIAVPGGVKATDIVGARQVGPDGRFIGPFVKNPAYGSW